jgi:hypothetical protein
MRMIRAKITRMDFTAFLALRSFTNLHQCSGASGRKLDLLLALAQARIKKAIMTFNIG